MSESRRIALLLEYDGTAYGGSQRQQNVPSVQATLEEAIERLAGCPVRTAFAGRTDSGVHALGQVAAFDTKAIHSVEVWCRGLNALLPEDIAVRVAVVVPAGVDPRRQARSRTYRYRIWIAAVRSPQLRR
ncbi:MAG: tRNA pseudouridine(38-40) synthase TruA, partial [Dehalococcoidia bacterium]